MKVEILTKTIREKLKSLEQALPPEVSWTKEASWARLNQKLRPNHPKVSKPRNGKTYSHYYAAASVAFLMTFSWMVEHQRAKEGAPFGTYSKPDTREVLLSEKRAFVLGPTLTQPWVTKPAVMHASPAPMVNSWLADIELDGVSKTKKAGQVELWQPQTSHEVKSLAITNVSKPKLRFEVPIGVSWLDKKVGPTLSLRATLSIPKNPNVFNSLAVSIHTHFLLDNQEGSGLQVAPQTFLNLEFEKTKYNSRNRRRSWQVGVGYLVTGKASILPGKTVKAFTSIGFGRFRLGPEIIITNDFKNVIPGFTITHS